MGFVNSPGMLNAIIKVAQKDIYKIFISNYLWTPKKLFNRVAEIFEIAAQGDDGDNKLVFVCPAKFS